MDKVFLTPEEYSQRSGLKVDHVRWLCRTGKIENIRTEGGVQYSHYKIPIRELTKFGDSNRDLEGNENYETLLKKYIEIKTIVNNIQQILNQIQHIL